MKNSKNSGSYTQLKDGRWVPAQPLPYYRDTRSVWLKIWHTIRFIYIPFIRDREARHRAEDKAEAIIESYSVPVEPYTDEDGNWRRW